MAVAITPTLGVATTPRVNLMPRAETDRREKSSLIRRWLFGLLAAILLVAVVTAGAFWLQVTAALRLAGENTRTDSLLSQLAELSDVRATVDLQSELTAFRQDAMATDLRWSGLLAGIAGALPANVVISGFSLAPGGMPQGDDPALEVGAGGSVYVSSASPQEIVGLVRAVRPLPGVLAADGWEMVTGEGGYTYELRVDFDQSAYTGAYSAEEEK